MDYPEPGSPQGAWELPGEGGGGYGGRYERAAGGEEEEEEAAEHPLARPPRRPRQRSVPPLRAALSTSSSEEGEPEAATPSDSTGGGEFDSAESGASLRYSSGTGEGGEGAGLASGESGGGGGGCSALPERKRPRSAAGGGRPRYEVVRELGAEEVRWFYREDRKNWKPFIGYDSLRIELAFRALGPGPERTAVEPVCVRSGLYEVDVANAECYPVYWNRECGRCRPGALGGSGGRQEGSRSANEGSSQTAAHTQALRVPLGCVGPKDADLMRCFSTPEGPDPHASGSGVPSAPCPDPKRVAGCPLPPQGAAQGKWV